MSVAAPTAGRPQVAARAGGAGARHAVLVGLPGAGKSTVGPRLAAAMGRPFLDFDAELERRGGRSVAEQFARDGEAAFRAREVQLSRELRDAAAMVLAPGGGWMANPDAVATLRPVGRIIYLRVRADTALARLGAGIARRPLLAGDDPAGALAALLARRSAAYEGADLIVDGDGLGPDAVAARVLDALAAAGEAGA